MPMKMMKTWIAGTLAGVALLGAAPVMGQAKGQEKLQEKAQEKLTVWWVKGF